VFFDSEAPTYETGFTIIFVLVLVGGVLATVCNWYLLRAANLKKDRITAEELDRRAYTQDELSKMGEYSPYFRYIL